MKSEFLIVAKELMDAERRPMSPRELVDLGLKRQLFSDNVAGKTPHQTMKSKLSVHIRRLGEASPFVRSAPGRFYLRHLLDGSKPPFEAKPIRPPKSMERVLVFETALLDRITTWQGLNTKWRRVTRALFSRQTALYRPRFEIEQDNRYTQILTYVLVTRHDAFLAYRRGTYNRVDQFLQGSFCVGFGGHVIERDLDLFNAETLGLYECAARELIEELRVPREDRERLRRREGLQIIGLINDDSSDVGRRHLAVVMKYEVSPSADWSRPERGEKAITQLQWISTNTPGRVWMWAFEYWSQLCLRQFAPQLIRARPGYRIVRRSPLRPPHLLCVIGPVGSGKTLATEVLKDDFGYHEINTGRAVAKLAGIAPVPKTPRQQFQAKAWEFISNSDGPRRLASEIIEMVRAKDSQRILIDGLRQRATLEALRTLADDLKIGVVFVHTPADLAYSFYSERIAQGATMAEFLAARSAPVEAEVEALISVADAVLYNWTGRLRYRDTIRALMEDLSVSRRSSS
jgi:predicted NUDIX family phosphoesterase/dephospho-CoA kinase